MQKDNGYSRERTDVVDAQNGKWADKILKLAEYMDKVFDCGSTTEIDRENHLKIAIMAALKDFEREIRREYGC